MSAEVQHVAPDPSTLEQIQEAIIGEKYYVSSYNSFGVVKFVGTAEFSNGIWVGLELPTPTGKNDGSVKGKRYFPCAPHHGIFVRTTACARLVQGNLKASSSNAASRNETSDQLLPVPHHHHHSTVSNPNEHTDKLVLPPAPPDHTPPPINASTVNAPVLEIAPKGVQILGSLTDLAATSDSSDEEDEGGSGHTRPLSPPLNLGAAMDDDSEGELEVCMDTPILAPNTAASTKNSQQVAMDAYLAAQAEKDSKKSTGLSLVSAMESSVNEIIGKEPAYQDEGYKNKTKSQTTATGQLNVPIKNEKDAFGVGNISSVVEDVTVAYTPEPDVFGIAYKPFKKTIGTGSDSSTKKKKTFDDEDEFEKDLLQSSSSKESSNNTTAEEDEFDFDTDAPTLDKSELRRTLQAAAEEVNKEEDVVGAMKSTRISSAQAKNDSPEKENSEAERNSGDESDSPGKNYDAYGDAKDALRAIVDIYGCGLGDQEIVIMNSLGADAVAANVPTALHAHQHSTELSVSIVPGTGMVSKGKPSKRSTGSLKVRCKVERNKIEEEDEEDYEAKEKASEQAQMEEELRAQQDVAKLESEWQSLPATPAKAASAPRKSLGGKSSPGGKGPSPRPSSLQTTTPPSVEIGIDEARASEAYDLLLSFFQSQDLTRYHSEIVTSDPSKGSSWLLGGNEKLKFDGADDELKFCFSIAHVNYDPVKYREHFSAMRSLYKFFVPPAATPATPTGANSRGSRARDVGMVGSHWGNVGFQGMDPCTDINRSMKMLSVLQVLHLIQNFPKFARCLHRLSQETVTDSKGQVILDLTWPFFCVSIGFTKHALQTVRSNSLNKRCNKFKSVLAALHEFYRACFFAFSKDMVEKSSIHHAHHLSTLRSAVDSSPMNVLKAYKTFIKKKTAVNPGMTAHEALCSIFDGHSCSGTDAVNVDGIDASPTVFIDTPLEAEDLEFAALDDIKDNLDSKGSTTEKGGLFSISGRKKGYITAST